MMEQSPNQLDRLEKKVDFLTWVVSVQAALIGVVAVKYVLQFAGRLLLLGLIVVPILFVFRSSIPELARRTGQMIGKVERFVRNKITDSHSSTLP